MDGLPNHDISVGASAVPDVELYDNKAIRAHCEGLFQLAWKHGIKSGVIIPMAIDPMGIEGVKFCHFSIKDDRAPEKMARWCASKAKDGLNVFVPWAVYKDGMPRKKRGEVSDATHILALVSDRDAYESMNSKTGELKPAKYGEDIIEPSYAVQSSIQGECVSRHEYFILEQPATPDDAKRVGAKLREAMSADSGTGDIVRILRVPGTPNIPTQKKIEAGRDPNPQPCPVIVSNGPKYTLAEIESRCDDAIAKRKPKKSNSERARPKVEPSVAGSVDPIDADLWPANRNYLAVTETMDRSDAFHAIVCDLYEKGFSVDQIERYLRSLPNGPHIKYINGSDRVREEIERSVQNVHDFKDWKPAALIEHERRSKPVQAKEPAVASEEHVAQEIDPFDLTPPPDWPSFPPEAAPGIVGEIVAAATANSEADPAAVTAATLSFAAATFGRSRYQDIGDDKHYVNLFMAVVGDSSHGRKGTARGGPQKVFRAAESAIEEKSTRPFQLGCKLKVLSGLSSGEGLLHPIRDGDPETGDPEKDEVRDKGEADKRMLVIESELSQMFTVTTRNGNTLTEALRDVFDGHESVGGMTKNNPTRVTGPHVVLYGNITSAELKMKMSEVNAKNGLANRFLWCASRRWKFVPDPKPMPNEVVESLGKRLAETLLQAFKTKGEIKMTDEALSVWIGETGMYKTIEAQEMRSGLSGLVGRGAAQVRRLAQLYALLEASEHIELKHLRSAEAFWQYSYATTSMIFGEIEINPNAQRVLDGFDDVYEMSQKQINLNVFGKRPPKNWRKEILDDLVKRGRLAMRKEKTEGARQPTTYYRRLK